MEGFVNEASILEVDPSIINKLKSREEVKEVSNLGAFKVGTKDGLCTLKLAPWSAEIGADGWGSGEDQWMLLWNLRLHIWCWSIIADVVRAARELVALSQATVPHKRFITALVRLRARISLLLEVDLSLGMSKYHVLIAEDRGEFMKFHRDLGRYVLPEVRNKAETLSPATHRFTHEISPEMKGKVHDLKSSMEPQSKKAVEHCSRLSDRMLVSPVRTAKQDQPSAIISAGKVNEVVMPVVEHCFHGGDVGAPYHDRASVC